MVTVTIETKGKPSINLDFTGRHPDQVTVADVKAGVNTKFPKVRQGFYTSIPRLTFQLVANRQRLTLPSKLDAKGKPLPLVEDSKSLGEYGIGEKATLRLKDLGAQTSYRNLYLWEYVSPT